MPIPKPRSDEKDSDFISRCMGDETMNKDYPDYEQRAAVCLAQIKKKESIKRDEKGRQIIAENVPIIFGATIETR